MKSKADTTYFKKSNSEAFLLYTTIHSVQLGQFCPQLVLIFIRDNLLQVLWIIKNKTFKIILKNIYGKIDNLSKTMQY